MKKLLSNLCYITCLASLIATHSCNCTTPNDTSSQAPLSQKKGYWHTGSPRKILKIPSYPQHTPNKELYERRYQIYQVTHDGSCGFRSFIPILLHEILGTGKLDQWLIDIENKIYKPAQSIMIQINDIAADILGITYIDSTTNSKLYGETKILLQKLNTEPVIRTLQEKEIELLVAFLRKCVIMLQVISIYNQYYKNKPDKVLAANNFKETLKAKIMIHNPGQLLNYWAEYSELRGLRITFGVLFDKEITNGQKTHNIHYYNSDKSIDGKTNPYEDNIHEIPSTPLMDLYPIDILMYHHNDMFFDYIIPIKDE